MHSVFFVFVRIDRSFHAGLRGGLGVCDVVTLLCRGDLCVYVQRCRRLLGGRDGGRCRRDVVNCNDHYDSRCSVVLRRREGKYRL